MFTDLEGLFHLLLLSKDSCVDGGAPLLFDLQPVQHARQLVGQVPKDDHEEEEGIDKDDDGDGDDCHHQHDRHLHDDDDAKHLLSEAACSISDFSTSSTWCLCPLAPELNIVWN